MARVAKAKIHYFDAKGTAVKITDNPAAIVFGFADGGDNVVIDVNALPPEIRAIAMVRGLAEKVRDTYAGSETVGDAREAAEDMIGRLADGEWLSAREGGRPRMSMLLIAIQEVKVAHGAPFDLDAARAKYLNSAEDTDETRAAKLVARKAAAANSEVAIILDRLRAEAAARRADKTPVDAADVDAL